MKKLLSILVLSILLTSCNNTSISEPVSDSAFYLGTLVTISLYDNTDKSVIDKCFNEIDRLEKLFSKEIETSDISIINKNAGISAVKVSSETIELIEKGIYYGNLSNGYFDISIGNLVNLWGIGTLNEKLPSSSEIKKVINDIDYNNIIIDKKNSTVFLSNKNASIDLGGIAKGYIADKIQVLLIEEDCKSALINLGGNVLSVGLKHKNTQWKVGVQDPFLARGNYIAVLEIDEKSIVTSGIYERFFIKDDIRYHHILNPFDGYPINNDIAGVTIISNNSIDGDALSTICFTLGINKALSLIESINNIETVLINKDGEIFYSSGIGNDITLTLFN